MIISFPVMFFLVIKCVPDSNYFSEEGVIPPEHVLSENVTNKFDGEAQKPLDKNQGSSVEFEDIQW